MRAKEFLKKMVYIDVMIDIKLEQVEELRTRLTSSTCSTDGERVQTSVKGDTMGDTIAKIIELENKIDRDVDKLVDYKNKARDLIESLDDDVEKIILYKRYFQKESFEQIAYEIHYSWRWVHKLHGNALQKLDKKLEEMEKCS